MAFLILASLLCTLVSLSGGLLLLVGPKIATLLSKIAIPLSVIFLSYAAFFDLLPEALEEAPSKPLVWLLFAAGLIFFTLLNRPFHSHNHSHSHKTTQSHKSPRKIIPFFIAADTLHTLIDGLVLGLSFHAGSAAGVAAAAAIALHELPHELADFALLLKSGLSKKHTVLAESLVALSLIPAAALSYSLAESLEPLIPYALSLAAGFFTYIAIYGIFIIYGNQKSNHRSRRLGHTPPAHHKSHRKIYASGRQSAHR